MTNFLYFTFICGLDLRQSDCVLACGIVSIRTQCSNQSIWKYNHATKVFTIPSTLDKNMLRTKCLDEFLIEALTLKCNLGLVIIRLILLINPTMLFENRSMLNKNLPQKKSCPTPVCTNNRLLLGFPNTGVFRNCALVCTSYGYLPHTVLSSEMSAAPQYTCCS